ncbi:MAG: hypothetical protein HQK65_07495 [Desulfamplus sp.]|nr:hypothetical protein [Desulfamplus sp.]
MITRTKEEQKERSKFLVSLFEDVKSKHDGFSDLFLCHDIIANLVVAYFDDIDRMKDYHFAIRLIDKHKIAAFTAKWIVKMRPVQFQAKISNPKKNTILANEIFALEAILSILGISNVNNIPDSLSYNLIYMFRYRHFTGKMLATICFCMDEMNQLKNG